MGDDSPLELVPDTSTTSGYSPLSPNFPTRSSNEKSGSAPLIANAHDDAPAIIQALQDQISTSRKAWQRQIWELEGQVRDLRAEVDELRTKEASGENCAVCGRGVVRVDDISSGSDSGQDSRTGIVNRPRARTGVGTRFGAGLN